MRPVVPMDASASSEETVMVLDPPDVPSIGNGARPAASSQNRQHRHSSKKSSSTGSKDDSPAGRSASNRLPVLLGGGAVVVAAVVATFWWFGRPAVSPANTPASPVAAVSAPIVTAASLPVAIDSQPADESQTSVVAATSSPAVEDEPVEAPADISELQQSGPPPALIVAPSARSGTETGGTSEHSAPKAESRHIRKTAPKKNAEEEYLRQIRRQLERQRK